MKINVLVLANSKSNQQPDIWMLFLNCKRFNPLPNYINSTNASGNNRYFPVINYCYVYFLIITIFIPSFIQIVSSLLSYHNISANASFGLCQMYIA